MECEINVHKSEGEVSKLYPSQVRIVEGTKVVSW